MRNAVLCWLFVLITTQVLALNLNKDVVYSVNYLKSFRKDTFEKYAGCSKSIAYGTYIYPKGIVDALYMLANPNIYGLNFQCNRVDTYLKLFGSAQDFDLLLRIEGKQIAG
jgi:hypothetical protein